MATPAELRTLIVEKLIGATGDPDRVKGAGRMLAERALSGIRRAINETLSSPLDIALKSVDLARIAELRPPPGGYEAMTICASAISADALLMLLDADAIALIVGAMFGADPDMPAAPITRDLSQTELEVANMTFRSFAQSINGTGQRSLDIRFPIPPAVSGAELQKQVLRDGPAVRIVFQIATAASTGTLTLFMPQRVLLKHRAENMPADPREAASAAAWVTRFGEEVKRSSVVLDATIALAPMTLGELARLKPGQVIEVPESAPGRARLSVKDKPLFVCEFGRLGQNYTVRIKQPFDGNQDLMEGILAG